MRGCKTTSGSRMSAPLFHESPDQSAGLVPQYASYVLIGEVSQRLLRRSLDYGLEQIEGVSVFKRTRVLGPLFQIQYLALSITAVIRTL